MVDRGRVWKILIIICRSKNGTRGCQLSQTIRLVRDGTEKGGGGGASRASIFSRGEAMSAAGAIMK